MHLLVLIKQTYSRILHWKQLSAPSGYESGLNWRLRWISVVLVVPWKLGCGGGGILWLATWLTVPYRSSHSKPCAVHKSQDVCVQFFICDSPWHTNYRRQILYLKQNTHIHTHSILHDALCCVSNTLTVGDFDVITRTVGRSRNLVTNTLPSQTT